MAFAVLNPLSALWLKCGLSVVLLPYDMPPAAPLTASQRPVTPHVPHAQPPDVLPGKRSRMSAAPQKPPVEDLATPWRPTPQKDWPAPWRTQLAATRPGLIVWTYWKLGEDLRIAPNVARRAFFQKLLTELRHPAGTHTFWPHCLPDSDTASGTRCLPNAEIFWSGAHALGARGVVVMGSDAMSALALPSDLPPLSHLHYRERGQFVYVLHCIDTLIREETRHKGMLAFLRRSLRDIANMHAPS
ncbi:MAG: conserved hypothetical protein [Candidatus Desulfovibrio kirbyi]|uniref:Uncharacterized protein n=1 Tax=Candidatus Desulfovibrio kirbyi TaxID=2696086 RepID=A0A6L2R534_9BACT|nr:MAG: conserved hypothetical protein [Candidatus Desulfovibrio kirbyi]